MTIYHRWVGNTISCSHIPYHVFRCCGKSLSLHLHYRDMFGRSMHTLLSLLGIAAFAVASPTQICNRDNCFRGVLRYQSASSTDFCLDYLATS